MFYLKVSRPGLWFATVWLYLLPTSGDSSIFYSLNFWIGLLYVSFPLNFLVYGWNDSVDIETDSVNPRKGSFWFGAKGTKEQLRKIWKPIAIVQLLFIPVIIYITGWKGLVIFGGFFLINWLYNIPERGLRSFPPLELLCQVGYLLLVPLSVMINETNQMPWQAYLYLFLFAMQSHLMGEVMDVKPDRRAKRKTTATVIGVVKTKVLIIVLVVLELFLLVYYFEEYIFSGILGIGFLWLLLDLFIIFKHKTYTMAQMKLFAISSNLIGFATIIYVWYTGCLLISC